MACSVVLSENATVWLRVLDCLDIVQPEHGISTIGHTHTHTHRGTHTGTEVGLVSTLSPLRALAQPQLLGREPPLRSRRPLDYYHPIIPDLDHRPFALRREARVDGIGAWSRPRCRCRNRLASFAHDATLSFHVIVIRCLAFGHNPLGDE